MPQSSSTTLLVVVLAAGLAACTPTPGQVPPPAAPDRPPSREVPVLATLASITESVLADAARRTGFARSELEVASAEAVTWSDGSLGCPEPGMVYTMALVPGYRIRIRAAGQLLDYHAGERGYFVLCPPGRAIEPVDGITM